MDDYSNDDTRTRPSSGIKAAAMTEAPIAKQIARIHSASMNIRDGLETFEKAVDPILDPNAEAGFAMANDPDRPKMSSLAETLSVLADALELSAQRLQHLPMRVEL